MSTWNFTDWPLLSSDPPVDNNDPTGVEWDDYLLYEYESALLADQEDEEYERWRESRWEPAS